MKGFKLHAGTALALTCQLLTGLIATMMGASMTRLAPVFGGDITRVSLLMSFIAVGRVATVIPSGILTDKFGHSFTLSVGLFIYSFFLFFLPRCGEWWLAAALCVCAGAGFGMVDSGVPAFMSAAHDRRYASMLSVCGIFFGLGALLSPFCISIGLEQGLELKDIYVFFSALSMAGFIAIALIRPGSAGAKAKRAMEKLPRGFAIRLILPCAAIFLFCALSSMVNAWCVAFTLERTFASESAAIMSLSAYSLGSICGNFASSLVLRRIHGSLLMLINPTVSLVLWLLIISTRSASLISVLFFVLGLFLGCMFAIILGVATAGAGNRTGTVSGTLAMTAGLGDVASPLVTSFAVGSFGVYAVFSSGAVLAALMITSGALIKRRYRKSASTCD